MVGNQPLERKGTPENSDRATTETSGGEKRSEAVAVIKLNVESERKADKATIEITGEDKCFDEGALRNARDAAENIAKGTCYLSWCAQA